MNICIFVGARPNFIKIAPIVRAIDKAKAEGKEIGSSLVYAGREDDPTLEPSLFDDLQIGRPTYALVSTALTSTSLRVRLCLPSSAIFRSILQMSLSLLTTSLLQWLLPSSQRSRAFCWLIL